MISMRNDCFKRKFPHRKGRFHVRDFFFFQISFILIFFCLSAEAADEGFRDLNDFVATTITKDLKSGNLEDKIRERLDRVGPKTVDWLDKSKTPILVKHQTKPTIVLLNNEYIL